MSKPETQAAAWLIRNESPDCTAEERERLEAWLSADPRNRAAYLRLQAAWQQSDQLRRLRPLDGSTNPDLLDETILPSLRGVDRAALEHTAPGADRPKWHYALAAAAALAVVAVGATAWVVLGRDAGQRYTTDFGGFERLTLRDGSTVSMNTDSRIRVNFTDTRREVVLERGEALFTVAPDTRRPFEVTAGDTRVLALGTSFSVHLRERNRVDVLVAEGRVAIDPPDVPMERAAALPSSVSTLSAGESLSIGPQPLRVKKMGAEEVSRRLGWMEGRVWFNQDTLTVAVAEFNRYNRRKLVIADPRIADLRVGGGFEANDPESFIAALERVFGVRGFASGSGEDEEIRLVGTTSQ